MKPVEEADSSDFAARLADGAETTDVETEGSKVTEDKEPAHGGPAEQGPGPRWESLPGCKSLASDAVVTRERVRARDSLERNGWSRVRPVCLVPCAKKTR